MNSILPRMDPPRTKPPDNDRKQNTEGESGDAPDNGGSPMAILTLAILASIVVVAIFVTQGVSAEQAHPIAPEAGEGARAEILTDGV